MTITAQAGIVGYGLNDNGAKGGAVQNWYRYRTARFARIFCAVQASLDGPGCIRGDAGCHVYCACVSGLGGTQELQTDVEGTGVETNL